MPCSLLRTGAIWSLRILALTLCLHGCRAPEPPAADPPSRAAAPQATSAPPLSAPLPDHNPTLPPPVPGPELPVQPASSAVAPTPGIENASSRPKIAIIIDDMGYSRVVGQRLVERVDALSFSFLPEAPYTQELAELAFQAGHTVLAHLPMEPKDRGRDPGAGALQVNDTEESIRKKMADMLAAVPHAMGANNHMGSRFTEHGVGMRRVLGVLNAQALFFVDSFTTAGSRGGNLARQLGVPTIRRHVFLDNVQDPDSICRQFELLTQMARQQGQAVGIGHPHQAMLTALDQCGPHAFHDVALVGVRQLVR